MKVGVSAAMFQSTSFTEAVDYIVAVALKIVIREEVDRPFWA